MDKEELHQHIIELKGHLTHFKQMLQRFETDFQQSLQHIHDPEAKSRLMENYAVNINRQEKAIEDMAELHRKAVQQLTEMDTVI